jgi:hypothetical protein
MDDYRNIRTIPPMTPRPTKMPIKPPKILVLILEATEIILETPAVSKSDNNHPPFLKDFVQENIKYFINNINSKKNKNTTKYIFEKFKSLRWTTY